MLQFLKYIFATVIGLFLFGLLIVCLIAAILAGSASDKKETISDNAVLKIVLENNITEREPDDFLAMFRGPFNTVEPGTGLLELRQTLEKAKSDPKIKGIFLDPSRVSAGFATLRELRTALLDFKKSGKFIISYGEFYPERAYYLASVSDRIFLPPSGLLELNGLETELLFFKGALEKLELRPEVFKVGEYKSAIEPLILDKMSDASRLQTTSFLNSIYNVFLKDISDSRKINFDTLSNISDSMLVRNAEDALKYKLITDLAYYDAAEDFLRSKTKADKDEKINFVSYTSYRTQNISKENKNTGGDKKIAVIFASGDINSGKGDDNSIGSESLAAEIRKAKLDKDVKAIVLRINSPGGSALASDVLWREIVLAKKEKPVIASMSDVAASGGYYIAMACDSILAQPTTITGSIGVFGILFNAEGFLKNKLGITSDRVTTGKFSDLGTPTRTLTSFERTVIQQEVDKIYKDFTEKAAQGRSMEIEKLKSIASGRVWSGTEAKENHLIDAFGGLQDAIEVAASASKSGKNYTVEYLPEQKNFYLKELMSQFGDHEEETFLKNKLGKFYPYFQNIHHIQKMEGIQARLPYEITIK